MSDDVDEDDLVEITLSIEPELESGMVWLEADWWDDEDNPIKLWLSEEKGTELIMEEYGSLATKTWNLSQETLPEKLYVEAQRASDVALTFVYDDFFDYDRVYFNVVGIESPAEFSRFTFSSANPGILSFDCVATYHNELDMDQYVWTIEDIGEIQAEWDPSTAHGEAGSGRIAEVTFTGLPEDNSSFGLKRITLSYNYDGISFTIYRDIKVFFPRDATNNPGGTTQNWYYYWTQITGSNNLAYGGAHATQLGYYDYNGSSGHLDKCIIYDKVTTTGNDDEGGGYGPPGIDSFGQTVIHERKHRDQFWGGYTDTTGDGIPDYDPARDQDGDWLSDDYEDAHGFDKTVQDTDSDGTLDLEEEPEAAEAGWQQDSHNNEDWANPGKNN